MQVLFLIFVTFFLALTYSQLPKLFNKGDFNKLKKLIIYEICYKTQDNAIVQTGICFTNIQQAEKHLKNLTEHCWNIKFFYKKKTLQIYGRSEEIINEQEKQ